MAKKAKKRSAKKRQNWCMMVIRVRVSKKDAKTMKVHRVTGLIPGGYLHDLEILNAYYDVTGQPNALT